MTILLRYLAEPGHLERNKIKVLYHFVSRINERIYKVV